jgi:hypothetical protein
LPKEIDSARKDAAFMKELAERIQSRPRSLDTSRTSDSLKDIVRERRNSGKNLMRLGAALLIIPDPITDVAAVPVLIVGKVVSARETVNIKGVYEEVRKTLSCLSSL